MMTLPLVSTTVSATTTTTDPTTPAVARSFPMVSTTFIPSGSDSGTPAPTTTIHNTPPMLLQIPNEIVILVANELSLSDRAAFLRTNKHLNSLCTADFYRQALRENGGTRGLRYAAINGNPDVASVFIHRYNVSPNLCFRDGPMADQTCLHGAASRGHIKLIKVLLEAGADVQVRNDAGRTPLHYAARGGFLEVVKLLVEHNANIMARGETEVTPLHSAAKKGHHLVCKFLLEHGAEVDAMCKDPQNEVDDGYTALHGAADFGHAEVAKLLLENGASVDAKIDQSEWTPLGCSSAEGHVEVVKHLLKWGAEVNVGPEVPLRLAVDGKWHEGVLRLLLEAGANVERALEGLFHTDTATRLTEFAEKWKTGSLPRRDGATEDEDSVMTDAADKQPSMLPDVTLTLHTTAADPIVPAVPSS
ncbi:ankyrin repeat-containing domain protein [Tricharina praecox]|uniref:ankyrin repeat-containing domain protein n=1 Tax=Tricharina praecox TaxID=43433 RepID=UPI00221FAFBA|nr:ankyrin repeat-containing domain protein [Tricharina praecox]KAI5856966.1 ankyrin repeat-containing domain protein [Tricharina praecox]